MCFSIHLLHVYIIIPKISLRLYSINIYYDQPGAIGLLLLFYLILITDMIEYNLSKV